MHHPRAELSEPARPPFPTSSLHRVELLQITLNTEQTAVKAERLAPTRCFAHSRETL